MSAISGGPSSDIESLIEEIRMDKGALQLADHKKALGGISQLLHQVDSLQKVVGATCETMTTLLSKQAEGLKDFEKETRNLQRENNQLKSRLADMEGKHLPGIIDVDRDGPDRAAGSASEPAQAWAEMDGAQAQNGTGSNSLGMAAIVPAAIVPIPSPSPSRSSRGSKNAEPSFTTTAAQNPPAREAAVFVDADTLKKQLKQNLSKEVYDVSMYYWETGCCQRIARSSCFENLTLLMIAVNSIWIWIDTDLNSSETLLDAEPVFVIMENLFCVYFCVELGFRFGAFKQKKNCAKDAWFVFDSVLVGLMVFETWILTVAVASMGSGATSAPGFLRVLRLFRLTRMARMARLLRACPELFVMLKAIGAALRSVMFALLLLLGLVYVFAIVFTQTLDTKSANASLTARNDFATVGASMNTLLLSGATPDQADLVNNLMDEGPVFYILILTFLLLASLTVMNMLIGILCEVISVVSHVESEEIKLTAVKFSLQRILEETEADSDGDKKLNREELEMLLKNPKAVRTLADVGVDLLALVDLMDFIFEQNEDLTFPEFMDIVLDLRGDNAATVKDIVDLRRFVSAQTKKIEKVYRDAAQRQVTTASLKPPSAPQPSLEDHFGKHA
ncbi:unnamed protein product [Durusdinium trenchii]|uniref:Ion transport domain-containing protein n=2 Tax=Durusdinium trenchii TaxID=1381693 RepID=A0ABP0PGE8_9DINO